jgi:hypothetical protein
MKSRLPIVTIIMLSSAAACNETVGDCWPIGQDPGSGSPGGGVIDTGAGASTSGDVPTGQAQSALSMDQCNATGQIAPQSPCNDKCDADYANAAVACGMIPDDAQRKACQDNAYASYKSCRQSCASSANEDCDNKYQDCVDNGPSSCLKRSGGKTLCQRCWERCNAGDSPSSECKACRF